MRESVKSSFKDPYKEVELWRPSLDGLNFSRLSDHNCAFKQTFYEEEILEAIMSSKRNKAPDSNEFNIKFFFSQTRTF